MKDEAGLAVAAAMVFQVSAHARAGQCLTAQHFAEQAQMLLAEEDSAYRELVRHGAEPVVEAARRRRQSLIAAIARHRLDEDARHRQRAAAIEQAEKAAERMLIEANRGDLCVRRPTVVAPGGVTVEELVAALELAVHELRRRLAAHRAAIESDPGDERRVAQR
ncbi:hypothetical protein ACFP3H_08410 [Nocardia lasii]|uniref:Uncharacterized protein n=1 Tax=Nocardia lasii TaxID=1616107 RepID=A0ABW1JNS9_9NOCA